MAVVGVRFGSRVRRRDRDEGDDIPLEQSKGYADQRNHRDEDLCELRLGDRHGYGYGYGDGDSSDFSSAFLQKLGFFSCRYGVEGIRVSCRN